jgi:hypothetical protein
VSTSSSAMRFWRFHDNKTQIKHLNDSMYVFHQTYIYIELVHCFICDI